MIKIENMQNVVEQYYPDLSELQKIRSLLTKKTGVQIAAFKASVSKNSVYKVLKGKWKNPDIIRACLEVIEEDAQTNINYARIEKEKLLREQRV